MVADRSGTAGWGSGQEATEAIAQRFFDFFIDVPRRLLCLEALSGGVGGGAGDHYRQIHSQRRQAQRELQILRCAYLTEGLLNIGPAKS